MVRIKSLSRGSQAARDENDDGRIGDRDERTTVDPRPSSVGGRTGDPTTYRGAAAPAGTGARTTAGTGPSGAHRATDETGRTAVMDRAPDRPASDGTDHEPDPDTRPEVVAPAGPRPRASLLATLSLIVGVSAALFVLTGALAGYGIALGVVAVLLAVGGFSATGRRHVAGKADALVGLLLGLGAIVVGILALTGVLPWLAPDADTVNRFRMWLDTQFIHRF